MTIVDDVSLLYYVNRLLRDKVVFNCSEIVGPKQDPGVKKRIIFAISKLKYKCP